MRTRYPVVTAFLVALTLLLSGLKLAGVTEMSWWWVLSPIVIPGAALLFCVLISVVIGMAATVSNRTRDRIRRRS